MVKTGKSALAALAALVLLTTPALARKRPEGAWECANVVFSGDESLRDSRDLERLAWMAGPVIRELERALWPFEAARPHLVVYHCRGEMASAMDVASWAGACANRVVHLGLQDFTAWGAADAEQTLRHEFTHALLNQRFRFHHLPSWLHEGLAQHFDGTRPSESRKELAAFVGTGGNLGLRGLDAM